MEQDGGMFGVAVKVLRGSEKVSATDAERDSLVKELRFGSRIQHENVTKYFGMWKDQKERHCLVMELHTGGNLHDALSAGEKHSWKVQ